MLDEQQKKQRHAEAPISCKASAQQFGGGAQGAEEPLGAHWREAAPLIGRLRLFAATRLNQLLTSRIRREGWEGLTRPHAAA